MTPGEVYDPKTKKMLTPQAVKAAKVERVYLSIDGALINLLAGFAEEDGIDMTADTALGRKVRRTNAVRKYVEVAIGEFVAARNAQPEAE